MGGSRELPCTPLQGYQQSPGEQIFTGNVEARANARERERDLPSLSSGRRGQWRLALPRAGAPARGAST